jgi:Peptidase family M23
MRRLLLTSATAVLTLAVFVPSAWAGWVWPLRGEVITPYRNGSDPYASGQHRGIDIAGDVGATVVAAAGGEVRFAGTAGSSGLTVSIRTADGRFDTSYLHLASTSVREGDRVSAGDRVGTVGTSGARSTAAPHLHFGVRDAGSRHAYHDPLAFLPPPNRVPQQPRETPAPQPAPMPVTPAPAPIQAPAGRRIPIQAPAGRRIPVRAPAGRRIPVRAPAGRRIPVRAPAGRRIPVRAPAGRRIPVGAPNPRRVPVGEPHARRAPRGGPAPRRLPFDAPRSRPASVHPRAGRRMPTAVPDARSEGAPKARPGPLGSPNGTPDPTTSPESPSSQGPDLGLVLACLGLVAAAALLGLTKDGQKTTRRTRQRVAQVLQPLLGRR